MSNKSWSAKSMELVANYPRDLTAFNDDVLRLWKRFESVDALIVACQRFVDSYPHGINPGLDEAYAAVSDALSAIEPPKSEKQKVDEFIRELIGQNPSP